MARRNLLQCRFLDHALNPDEVQQLKLTGLYDAATLPIVIQIPLRLPDAAMKGNRGQEAMQQAIGHIR